jgi:hypothetical protein
MSSDQASQGVNGLTWELIFTHKCEELVNLVKEWKRHIKHKIYTEKIDREFTPFTSMAQAGNIEQAFWDHGKTVRKSLPELRNQCVFLHFVTVDFCRMSQCFLVSCPTCCVSSIIGAVIGTLSSAWLCKLQLVSLLVCLLMLFELPPSPSHSR